MMYDANEELAKEGGSPHSKTGEERTGSPF